MSEHPADGSKVPDERSYEQRLEIYRSVASGVAHDLNNLLLLISGYTEILSKNLDDREQVLQIVKNIQTATSGVRELTERLQLIGNAPDDVPNDAPITQSDDVLVLSETEHGEARIFMAIDNEELRELTSRVFSRGGFDVVEINGADFTHQIGHSSDRFTNVFIIDTDAFQSSRGKTLQTLLLSNSDVPTLFLVDDAGDIPSAVTPLYFSTLAKPFLPSQLISAVDGLCLQSKMSE